MFSSLDERESAFSIMKKKLDIMFVHKSDKNSIFII